MTRHQSQRRKQLSDIAEETGFSLATVSKVLNGRSDVAPQTREIISRALEKNHYVRRNNPAAHSEYIEVVLQSFDTVWSLEVLRGVLKSAKKHGLSVITTESGSRTHPDDSWMDGVIRRGPYGVILVFSKLSAVEHSRLNEHHIPYVILDPAGNPSSQDSSIQADDWNGALEATRHLISLGHTQLGIITGPRSMLCARARLDGFKAALAEAGLEYYPRFTKEGDFTADGVIDSALDLLRDPQNRPTAIFGSSDLQCMGIYEAARQLNISIPYDLSVVGFDDIQTARYLSPQLTTVRQPIEDMAQAALDIIVNLHKGTQQHTSQRAILPTRLIVRDSTARVRNADD
ncbi:LacI family DNA-binding transcriptional regulator [Alloscardovia omnicolens]|uniref:LacI family DNA-binding transcriptional regulator n=1 Tax=Alloscardovia omnicolens TaxID=419015 RepID=UPI0006684F17|nr:LacI family DNA-binding transcriptional regulator [Alloscardovia omnicolens]KWZ75091.1 sugar-binding domain protein [Alloscardovia omnicolens]MDK8072980.1 LacI family DNA-binding transcriptional regulator [Alloscardovia omnicolens]